MGIDQQAMDQFEQGVTMFDKLTDKFMGSSSESADPSKMAEEQAKLMELNAAGTASDQRRQARGQATQSREELEENRSRKNTKWGQSNLAMSGSKQLIRDSDKLQDRQKEEDLLFEGEHAAQKTLKQGRREANMFRINNDLKTPSSTLSLGSTIYNSRR
ncbi:hypothetical protein [Pseudodesulfovibrio piezophilus]|uniref:Uncharacterized protein n=1 Tax=Pseudodesulfovibrio piezophilus (strain DSM 21447 / JCM 15486 / C1TLV30) TaxID=1322246 RepID=M1WTJ5_PSEP2|nr:hypothetical protein [Pseudodesulfovibrio piezophilus]CCH49642.1 conserved protein of unknown function [Pseudodesulfovibrio piezophilus C1TLV30]